MKMPLPLCLGAAALALASCGQEDSNNVSAAETGEAGEAAGEQTIAASVDQNSRFFQAAKAVGLDATLEGPGPYTVLVPTDEAFGQVEEGVLADPANPDNRAEITRILTYHILPGVILAEDIETAISNGNGKAILATMGGETLTATKDGDSIVLADSAGGKARVAEADGKASNGVVHRIDTVLMPPAPGAGSGSGQGDSPSAQ